MNFAKGKLLCVFVFFVGSYLAQRINVFDTLVSHHLFSHLENEKKDNYWLDDKGYLRRKVILSSDEQHYHKSHEDSIYIFLKEAYKDKFENLIFFSGEKINWILDGSEKFSWKKGIILNKEKLDKVYANLAEINCHPKRPLFMQDEESAHFFFYHNYLLDSIKQVIYCFNTLKGVFRGKIFYNESGQIISEKGYYDNGSVFYELTQDFFTMFTQKGEKIFESDKNKITRFSEQGKTLWNYDRQTRKITGSSMAIKDYLNEVSAYWKSVMKK